MKIGDNSNRKRHVALAHSAYTNPKHSCVDKEASSPHATTPLHQGAIRMAEAAIIAGPETRTHRTF